MHFLVCVTCPYRTDTLHIARACVAVASRYRYFGKLVAAATRSSTTAKYDAVIARLLAIMPTEQPQQASAAGGSGSGHVARLGGLLGTANNDSGSSTPCGPATASIDRTATTSTTNTVAAAAGVLERMLKGSAAGAAGSDAAAAADSNYVLVRSGEHDKVTSMCFLPPPDSLSAAACVWWAVNDRLEFYSGATQSTTSFAAAAVERAAITALTLDSAGNVWGGTAKGTVFMRQRTNWQQVGGANACVGAAVAEEVVCRCSGSTAGGRPLRFREQLPAVRWQS
jgi:hypothetical protein